MALNFNSDHETEAFVLDQLAAGEFSSADEIVRKGLVYLKKHGLDQEALKASLLEKLAKCDDGRPDVGEAVVFEKISTLLTTLKRGRAA